MRNTTCVAVFLIAPLMVGCGQSRSGPGAVADAFVEKFYVERDVAMAAALTTGVARERLEAGAAGATGPVIAERLSERSIEAGSATYVYRVTPTEPVVNGARDTVHVSITVRDEGGVWLVASFSETEAPPRP